MKAKLTPRQHRFVLAYLKDPNGTKAAIEAGYSPKGADVAGVRLLVNARVRNAIAKRTEIITQTEQLEASDVVRGFMELAFTDRTEAYRPDGSLRPMEEWSPALRACFAGISFDKFGRLIAQWEGKAPALNSLARHLPGFFKDKLEVTGKDGEPLTIVQVKNFLMSIEPKAEPKMIDVESVEVADDLLTMQSGEPEESGD